MVRILVVAAIVALAGCKRAPTELAVSYARPAADAGLAPAAVATVRTTSPEAVARVEAVIDHARSTSPLLRCTFLEGGEPPGLRFELGPQGSPPEGRRRIYLRPHAPMVMTPEGCHATAPQPDLEALAASLGVTAP